ncbi:ABC transporter ATP-binding protein [Anaerobacillus alkaliphilus]|uniref:ABC transporter ATP-binding protein n=1 Tax=Anaerobacillus alkaliphilus TaxID=1548597 RepID=A0A4Q0VT47_9BACI|nr:ABC transporter ATP-binding protein [Anaerobacillus alkaliphilus]RXJ00696.1 ABC transporter ATP-binding protein [Anaerobacillus alkaliphilus]
MSLLTVSVEGVSKHFGKQKVLDKINLKVYSGEIFGLLGPSGAGKTTLVKIIAGIDTASCGKTQVLNVAMPNLENLKKVGYMAQSDALYSELTAYENLDFFATIYGLKGTKKKEKIFEVMKLVNLVKDITKPVNQFSGGMKRRLSLAVSLLHNPDVLILDEPTVGIDPVLRQAIWEELRRISESGTTIIVTTHVMDEAERCDRLALLRDGTVIATGTTSELKKETNSETIEEVFLVLGGSKQ